MPAYWDFQWDIIGQTCYSEITPYKQLQSPVNYDNVVVLPVTTMWLGGWIYDKVTGTDPHPQVDFICYINTPANPDFIYSNVSPQFALDTGLPSTMQVRAFAPINAAASATHLNVYSTSLALSKQMTAQSVSSDGGSAVFPYPTGLASGAYITTITTGSGTSATTNGFEPIYIAHNDTSFTSAFGVVAANPTETIQVHQVADVYGDGTCAGFSYDSSSVVGGTQFPIVTMPTLGEVALGSMSKVASVGLNPTAIVLYNDQGSYDIAFTGVCDSFQSFTYSGAQSALVVNTGSNSVSLLNIGQDNSRPTGIISVGTLPVAAVVNADETLAYVANYGSASVSEIDLTNAHLSRTLSVNTHPTSVSFDANGVLWVGGQGYLQSINTRTWTISNTIAIDGTATGLSYDKSQGVFVVPLLKNGSAASPSSGITMNSAIAFSQLSGASYSTTSIVNSATGSSATSSIASDADPYEQSSLVTRLAYPGQTAFNPPIYTSGDGDLFAVANGNTFTVSTLSTGKVLLTGTLQYPIRGVYLTPTKLYFTMPESNSLITLPIQLPQ